MTRPSETRPERSEGLENRFTISKIKNRPERILGGSFLISGYCCLTSLDSKLLEVITVRQQEVFLGLDPAASRCLQERLVNKVLKIGILFRQFEIGLQQDLTDVVSEILVQAAVDVVQQTTTECAVHSVLDVGASHLFEHLADIRFFHSSAG